MNFTNGYPSEKNGVEGGIKGGSVAPCSATLILYALAIFLAFYCLQTLGNITPACNAADKPNKAAGGNDKSQISIPDSRGLGMNNGIEITGQGLVDKAAITEIIQNWGFWRDQGRWDDLRTTFHPEGTISVSWFQGAFQDFVTASIKMKAGGVTSKHHMCGTTVQIKGTKAIAETNVILIAENRIDYVPVFLTSYMRFHDRVEKREGTWRILKRDAIYDSDIISLVNPSDRLVLDTQELEKFPKAYRSLGYLLGKMGRKVDVHLPTGNSPEEEKIKQDAGAWLER